MKAFHVSTKPRENLRLTLQAAKGQSLCRAVESSTNVRYYMTRGGAKAHTRAKTRLRLLRLLVFVVTALSFPGPVCCKAGGHQSKTYEDMERDVGLDPKRDDIAPRPPTVAQVEYIRPSSHGSNDQASRNILTVRQGGHLPKVLKG